MNFFYMRDVTLETTLLSPPVTKCHARHGPLLPFERDVIIE